jgi:hypothetical protein
MRRLKANEKVWLTSVFTMLSASDAWLEEWLADLVREDDDPDLKSTVRDFRYRIGVLRDDVRNLRMEGQ